VQNSTALFLCLFIGEHLEGVDIMAIKDYAEIIQSMREDNKSYGDIAKVIGYHRDSVKKWCRDNGLGGLRAGKSLEEREEEYIKRFNKKFPDFEYISGYETYDSKIKVKCKICGHVQERHANSKDCMQCDNCIKIERKKRLEQLNEEKQNRVRKENEYTETECVQCGKVFLRRSSNHKYCSDKCARKANSKKVMRTKTCKECGKEFITDHDKTLYCSSKCSNRYRKKRNALSKDKRLSLNGKIDYSISLKKLYKRDKGICYICGKQCNLKDVEITEEGYYIAGEDYPSIDHVIPIAKGGKHSWNNIKLAHRRCNAVKGDKLINEIHHKQLEVI
jgi:5-methylcytosine-specific restriction endonuclease McrA